MYDTPLTIEQNLTMLAATPWRIADLTEGLLPAQLLIPPKPGEWSARDVLAHLRACADMWGKYIVVILTENPSTFKAVNLTSWIKQTNYLEQDFQLSLLAFTAQRAELLVVLRTTAALLAGTPAQIRFIHLNHSNPLFDDGAERRWLEGQGMTIGVAGERFALAEGSVALEARDADTARPSH